MTPKDKAIELIEKFKYELIEQAKQYALIAVNEILNYQTQLLKNYNVKLENTFWQEVKTEIEKL